MKSSARGLQRNRRGRGFRQPALSPLYPPGEKRLGDFETAIVSAVEFLRRAWPDELGKLEYRIVDGPSLESTTNQVRRWSVIRDPQMVVIFRHPIERFGALRNALDNRIRIEQVVFEAAGNLIGKDPWELLGD
ncbi:MAG: hypothetical protein RL670_1237 [Actinomycetota bacterium]|jgi:hypothetical protein